MNKINNKNNSQGFAILEMLIALAVILALVGGGVGVMRRHNSQEQARLASKQSANNIGKTKIATTGKAVAPLAQESIPATTSTEAPKMPPATKVKSPTYVTPSPISHPTADELTLAQANVRGIKNLLELHRENYGYYPWDLAPGPLTTQPGQSGDTISLFTAPTGTSYYFECLKGGPGKCSGFKFQLLKSDGTVVQTIYNDNW